MHEPTQVETRLEAQVRQALVLIQVLALFLLSGWAVIAVWNMITYLCGLRRWFRRLPFCIPSAVGGLFIGGGFGWPFNPAVQDSSLFWWWPVVAILTLAALRVETMGWLISQQKQQEAEQ